MSRHSPKPRLLEKSLSGDLSRQTLPTAIPRRREWERVPLSYAQERLWFLDQLEPNTPVYNTAAAIRLTGQLNLAGLEESINELIRRHEALRTTFMAVDGEPMQVIAPALKLALPLVDLQALHEAEREAEVQRLTDKEARQPFDLARGPLMRTTLLRLGLEEHVLLLTMHHIITDGWSLGVFFQELGTLYEAFSRGEPASLPPLPIQYADFAVWQRQWLQGEVLEAELAYWKRQLTGVPPALQLPTDRPRPPIQTYRGARQSRALSPELTRALKTFSQQERVTLFMTLLAAYNTLLYRYTGREDMVVGSPIANRNRVEIEGLIGFFANNLVLRTDLAGNPAFRELLVRVREVCLGAYAHQDLPFEKLVEELQLERESSYQPLVQVMLGLQHAPTPSRQLPGLNLSFHFIDTGTAKFDLILSIMETQRDLTCSFEYNTDLFNTATVERMMGHFETLLGSIVAHPHQRLADLPLLTDAERRQLLVTWNETQSAYPRDRCIHELFEDQVERTSDAVAVLFGDQHLTYRELNQRANQLAHHLQGLGIDADVPVGICMERSLDMIVGLLGILKAGGAYVPLDPSYPAERLAFMLKDTRAPILLTHEQWVGRLPHLDIQAVCLDTGWDVIAQERAENPASRVTADNLAYVTYTSGSTGIPKGVAVAHRAVNRLVFGTNYITLAPSDRVAQISNASFDAATFEIWGALLHGARLVGISRDVALSPEVFANYLRQQHISVLFLTTALFNQIVSAVPNAFASLRCVLFGGEAVDPRWVKEVLRHGPPGELIHVYGPTESTTFSTWHLVHNVPEEATTIPIGRPISNTQTYILDAHLQPVPIGVPGELHIGGDGLAVGYLHRSALTAEQFVANPFSDEPKARLYKTGDLARYLPDGNIEFLGRLDDQVKIRGFRVELGEIEAVLRQHPGVADCVVVARELGHACNRLTSDRLADKQLVAYVVPRAEPVVEAGAWRAFVSQKLPDYMIPAAFVRLDTLPLTPNGKVDRQALPAPDVSPTATGPAFIAPRSPVEEAVATIWCQVLDLDQVSVHVNFFELGGHSLLATRLVSRLCGACKVDLPLHCLFEAPTVAALAARIQAGESERQVALPSAQAESMPRLSLMALHGQGLKRPFFVVPGGGGGDLELFTYAKWLRHLPPDQPIYGFQARGMDGAEDPHTCVEDMASDYIKALQTVQPEGPYLLGGECLGGIVAFEMARQLQSQGCEIAFLVLMDTRFPDLGNLVRHHLRLSPPVRLVYYLSQLLQVEPDERWAYLADGSRKVKRRIAAMLGRTEDDVPRRIRATRQGYAKTLLRYRPKTYAGKLTLLVSEEFHQQYLTTGWANLASSGVELHIVPGDHNSYVREHGHAAARHLAACLNQAQGG